MTWNIIQNKRLSFLQRFYLIKGAFSCRSLVFLINEDINEYISFGEINEKNIKQAKACLDALNKNTITEKKKPKPKTYYAGYDHKQVNILGFPKLMQIFKSKSEAFRHWDIVYPVKIKGDFQ
jgi:hypothetical protein